MKNLLKQLTICVLLIAIANHVRAQDDQIHVATADQYADKILSQMAIQSRLIESAKHYENVGRVERTIHYDFAYPANREEYLKMNGFGILWVTSHSHQRDELPLKNVRITMGPVNAILLREIAEYVSVERDALISKVFGENRSDAIYLVPLYQESQGASLLADYSLNRTDFRFGKLDHEFNRKIGTPVDIKGDIRYPEKAIFESMLAREFPAFAELNMRADQYDQSPLTWIGPTIEQQGQLQPVNAFRNIGNTIICKTQAQVNFPCMQIGAFKVGDPYQPVGQPMQEIALPMGDTASAFVILKTDTQHAYWVIGHKNGKITSVQLTGNHPDPGLTFSSIGLGDTEEKVRSLMGDGFARTPVEDIKGVEWDYSPFPFSFEFVNGKVYSIRTYDIEFCDKCTR